MTGFDKPSRAEEEYFSRQEIVRRKELSHQQAAKMQAEEKQKLKDLHWMKCPKCGMDLAEIGVQNVKVDECGNCGGIFLDAGELDLMLKSDLEGRNIIARVFGFLR